MVRHKETGCHFRQEYCFIFITWRGLLDSGRFKEQSWVPHRYNTPAVSSQMGVGMKCKTQYFNLFGIPVTQLHISKILSTSLIKTMLPLET